MTQDSARPRVSEGMEASPRLTGIESVCCLDCGKVYGKPSGGGTLSMNPGCPHCGYVGWLPHAEWLRGAWPRDRFGADRRPRRSVRSG
jgi:hypothetical protein